METVRKSYEAWLTEDPLGRLRLKVEIPQNALAWPRTEKRALAMPSAIVAGKVEGGDGGLSEIDHPPTQCSNCFACFNRVVRLKGQVCCSFSYGVHKGSSNPQEMASNMRQWLRWLDRSEELGLVLPDPMVLAGVLGKMSDSPVQGWFPSSL